MSEKSIAGAVPCTRPVAAEAAPTVLKTFASDSVAAKAAPTSYDSANCADSYTVRTVPRDSILMFFPDAAFITCSRMVSSSPGFMPVNQISGE